MLTKETLVQGVKYAPAGLSARPPKVELNKHKHVESLHESHFMNHNL